MKPSLCLTTIALAMATPFTFAAEPLAPITVYGKINVSAESVSDSKTEFEHKTDVVSNSSRFGIKGGAAISDSLDAIYTLEWGVNVSDDSAMAVTRTSAPVTSMSALPAASASWWLAVTTPSSSRARARLTCSTICAATSATSSPVRCAAATA